MGKARITIVIDERYLRQLDQLVEERLFTDRSQAIQRAVEDILQRIKSRRLARECAKLDPEFEKALAEADPRLRY